MLLFLIWIQLLVGSLGNFSGVHGNFNFYLDRREFQKLHGISTDIYYVRDGVVNEYATSFVVTIPADVEDLNFSWQALSKRSVHYELEIDYTDFFALLPPIYNISKTGRVPQNLEVFRLRLPCSGRSSADVSVTVRIAFQIKNPKLSKTTISIKRNKICLLSELPPSNTNIDDNLGVPPSKIESPAQKHFPKNTESTVRDNEVSFFENPSPTLLLNGLLGGCAVTASAVFLTFFVCLRRKLTQLQAPPTSRDFHGNESRCHEPSSSNNSSPAYLIRQSQPNCNDSGETTSNGSWKNSTREQHCDSEKCYENVLKSSGSQNSYITIPNFWNDSATSGSNVGINKVGKYKDVSPYAYAQVLHKPPPLPKTGAPPLIEWYSEYPYHSNSPATTNSYVTSDSKIHLYGNEAGNRLHTPSARNSKEYGTTFQHQNQDTSTIKSTTGSLIQIDGFQCRKNLANEKSVVERFL